MAEDPNDRTFVRLHKTLIRVLASGSDGITTAEMGEYLEVGHGQASNALAALHRNGKVVRLRSRRNKQELYVVPDHVNGRKESPYNERNNRKHPKYYSDAAILKAMEEADITPTSYGIIRRFLEALP